MNSTYKYYGFSLVELLVALFISAVIFAGVINTLLASKSAYLYDEEVAYIQENSRFALDYLSRELREAGYTGGCNINSARIANSLDADTDQADLYDTTSIEGFEGGVSVFPASFSAEIFGNTDAFIVRKADSDNELTVTNHNGNSASIHVSPDHSFQDETVMMMVNADCSQVGIFEVTGSNGAGTPTNSQMGHNTGGGSSNNCTRHLTGDFDCACLTSGSCTSSNAPYQDGSSVFQLSAKAFYIGVSSYDADVRSLYVRSLNDGGSVSSSELVSGIEDMQILYGVDTEADSPDGEANRYYTADQITVDRAVTPNWIGWDRVVSARVTLVMRSRNAPLTADSEKTMPTLGTTYDDRYLYQEVSTTVNLRNNGLPANPIP